MQGGGIDKCEVHFEVHHRGVELLTVEREEISIVISDGGTVAEVYFLGVDHDVFLRLENTVCCDLGEEGI